MVGSVVRRAASLAAMLALVGAAADAGAIGLGGASVQSGLGERLRMSFPVSTQPDEEVGCVQVRSRGDDLPAVFNARAAVLRNRFQTRIEVTSAQPVNEPAIGLVVSVGCVSPVSREYVLFLDPPVVAPEASPDDASVLPPARPARAAPTRRPPIADGAASARRPSRSAAIDPAAPSAAPRPLRPRRPIAPRAQSNVPLAGPATGGATGSAAAPTPPAAPGRDRLTIAPTEPTAPVAAAPASNNAATPTASGTGGSAAGPAGMPGSAVSAGAAAASAAGAAADPALGAREQAMRDQQADLQRQVKALSDQIAALRVQTTSLAARNRTLEETTTSSQVLPWLLIALTALAVLVAGWMAWRYLRLRRSVDGAAWWAGNTVQAATDESRAPAPKTPDLAPLDGGTRLGVRPAPVARPATQSRPVAATDPRASASGPQAAATSAVERARPVARNAGYSAAIDTDFTVSDIEAAMATVRTVSPARETPRPASLEDSDFAPLGGPTLPSPFAETPPPAAPRAPQVAARGGDDLGRFVDLDIPPQAAPPAPAAPVYSPKSASPLSVPAAPAGAVPADPEAVPLDFSLDIPHAFDPLGTDSLKTTEVDAVEARQPIDFELSGAPTPLDFELPPSDDEASRTHVEANDARLDVRHGATALDDLFAPLGGPGRDSFVDLDERDGSPLSTTEIDRLTTTAVDAVDDDATRASTRLRMARFADLMNQVDEVAGTDPLRAIAHLRQYVLRDELIPTLLWLRLFDLYRIVDKKPVFEALAEHFARRYHRPMVPWDQTLADRVPQTPLSAMGPIDREIEATWGTEDGLERLRSLLCDRDQPDVVVFNAVLQRDLLDAAKVFPPSAESQVGQADLH